MPCEPIRWNETCPSCGWAQGNPEPHPIALYNNAKHLVAPINKELSELRAKMARLEKQLADAEKG